jgi:hypothetical protein
MQLHETTDDNPKRDRVSFFMNANLPICEMGLIRTGTSDFRGILKKLCLPRSPVNPIERAEKRWTAADPAGRQRPRMFWQDKYLRLAPAVERRGVCT